MIKNERSQFLFNNADVKGDIYLLAWTTTPWTLPSNTGLAVGENVEYNLVQTFNPYTFKPQAVILAAPLLNRWFPSENAKLNMEDYEPHKKHTFAFFLLLKGLI